MLGALKSLLEVKIYRASFVFYLLIIIAAVLPFLLSSMYSDKYTESQKTLEGLKKSRMISYLAIPGFFLSFSILWFVNGFATNGTDRNSYRLIFSDSTIVNLFDGWQEPGYIFLNLVFKIFTNKSQLFLIFIAGFTLLLIYVFLFRYREDLVLWASILGYGCVFFVQSISLMRIYLAAAILVFGLKYLLERRYFAYLIVILCTTLIHYSALIVIFPWFLMILADLKHYQRNVRIFLIVAILIVALTIIMISPRILKEIVTIERFQRYFSDSISNGFGIMQFIYNAPILFIIGLVYKYLDQVHRDFFISFYGCYFLLCMGSYSFTILGRATYLLSMVYLYIIPYCLKLLKVKSTENNKKWLYSLICCGLVIYYVIRFCIYFVEYGTIDKILVYTNIWL